MAILEFLVVAFKQLFQSYNPGSSEPLLSCFRMQGWQLLTDSRVIKTLSRINVTFDFSTNCYTFHTFRHSGATLAYKACVPVNDIKEHGTWTLECFFKRIKSDQYKSDVVANVFKNILF